MKKIKTCMLAVVVVLSCFLVLAGGPPRAGAYVINDYFFMSPGDNEQREFLINDVIDYSPFGPMEGFLAIAVGSEEEPAGALSITLKASPTRDFGGYLTLSLLGLGFSLDAGPIFFMESATTPFDVTATADISSIFGFVYAGAYINSISDPDNVELPVPCTITFGLSAAEPPPAEE